MGRCSACHNLSFNIAGPTLCGILGRRAGSAPGYAYSPALRQTDITSADSLDQWLSDPRAFIPGTKMSVRVIDLSVRRDIIAFLAKQGGERDERAARDANAQEPSHHRANE